MEQLMRDNIDHDGLEQTYRDQFMGVGDELNYRDYGSFERKASGETWEHTVSIGQKIIFGGDNCRDIDNAKYQYTNATIGVDNTIANHGVSAIPIASESYLRMETVLQADKTDPLSCFGLQGQSGNYWKNGSSVNFDHCARERLTQVDDRSKPFNYRNAANPTASNKTRQEHQVFTTKQEHDHYYVSIDEALLNFRERHGYTQFDATQSPMFSHKPLPLILIRTQCKPRHPEQYNITTDFIIEYKMFLDNFVRRPPQIAPRVTGAMAADCSLLMMDVAALAADRYPYVTQVEGTQQEKLQQIELYRIQNAQDSKLIIY